MWLLGLPAFLLVVFVMYWSLPLAALTFFVKPWKFWGTRNDILDWTEFLVRAYGVRVLKLGDGDLYRGGKCMYLGNHRSWADFFLDAYLTEGRAQLMSRTAVLFVFPMFMIPVTMLRACIVFKRGSIADKAAFNAWIDSLMDASPQPGLMLFPEGHRSCLPRSLPLKRGMLHYAFSRKLPIQVVMSSHKEAVVSEKAGRVGWGCTIITSYGRVIQTSDFTDFEAFFSELQAEWDAKWLEVFSADAAGLPPLCIEPQNRRGFKLPLALQASQWLWITLGSVLMVLVVRMTWSLAAAAAAALGGELAQKVLLAALLAYTAASVAYSCDLAPLPPLLTPDGRLTAAGEAAQAEGRASGHGRRSSGGGSKAKAKAQAAAAGVKQTANGHATKS